MGNILDPTLQAAQLEVGLMDTAARLRELELVEVCKKAWSAIISDVKILYLR